MSHSKSKHHVKVYPSEKKDSPAIKTGTEANKTIAYSSSSEKSGVRMEN